MRSPSLFAEIRCNAKSGDRNPKFGTMSKEKKGRMTQTVVCPVDSVGLFRVFRRLNFRSCFGIRDSDFGIYCVPQTGRFDPTSEAFPAISFLDHKF